MRLTREEQEALMRAVAEGANEIGERFDFDAPEDERVELFVRVVERLIATGRAEQVTFPAGTHETMRGRDGETAPLDASNPVIVLEGGRLVRLVVAEGPEA